jgi:protein-lysine methyltransferase-like protein
VTTFSNTDRESATRVDARELDTCPQKAVTDFSPSRLGARALVEGYGTSPLEGAHYLEIGTRSGTNLIAQAVAFPQTAFTAAPLADCSEIASLSKQARVANVRSGDLDLASFESSGLATYDFITAADVFSTAATAERMALLVLTKKHLAEDGIACISVDVTPGWQLISDLKTELCQRLEQDGDPAEQVELVRARMNILAKKISAGEVNDRRHLLGELGRLSRASDAEVYRDLLDPNHRAVPIGEFLAMADAAKLKPIGDIDPAKSNPDRLPSAMRGSDGHVLTTAEIYDGIDKHTGTKRRHVLLVHAEREKKAFDLGKALGSLRLTSDLSRADRTITDRELLAGGPITFVGPLKYRTENPIEIVALALLERHKYFPVRVDHLVAHIIGALKPMGIQPVDALNVSRALFTVAQKLLPTGALVTHLEETRAVSRPGERPVLSPLALAQARQGATHVASLLPHSIAVDETACFILSRLDGTQAVNQIVEELAESVSKGELALAAAEGTPQARAKATVLRVLRHAAKSGLLVS